MKLKSKEVAEIRSNLNKAIGVAYNSDCNFDVVWYIEKVIKIMDRKDEPDQSSEFEEREV